jgi:hypothetical protein
LPAAAKVIFSPGSEDVLVMVMLPQVLVNNQSEYLKKYIKSGMSCTLLP